MHSATGPALGYQYQADYCLLELLRNRGPGRAITLELHDDVAWEQSGTPLERLQLKHKINAAGGLGDRSAALWKTLKVWMDEGLASGDDGPDLMLISSGQAQPGSATYALRKDHRDARAAATALRAVASEATGAAGTAAAREKFMRLGAADQMAFVSRIVVVDQQPTVVDIDSAIRDELYLQLPPEPGKADDFMEQLWGWWRGRVVEMLAAQYHASGMLRARVESSDLRSRLQRMAVEYSSDGLPTYDQFDVGPDDPALEGLHDEMFVAQMKLVDAHFMAIRKAVVDYYRATSSETEWFKGDYLRTDDVLRYERKLRDAWEVAYGNMLTALGDSAGEDEQITAGRVLLAETLQKLPILIRPKVDQDFYYRGKHHMLAQRRELGWHPEFRERVAAMLLPEQSAS